MAQSKPNNKPKNTNSSKPKGKPQSKRRGSGQPKKDSDVKRVNYDNTREDKFERDMGSPRTEGSNPPETYGVGSEIVNAAASFPVSTTTGLKLGLFTPSTATTTVVSDAVPGVMAIAWTPSVGGNEVNPINAAANSFNSFVVHANSRNRIYTATDLMIVTIAGANLFSMLEVGKRAYGIMRQFNQTNKYVPDALLRAMGFDPDDLRQNYSQMWFDINEMIARSRQVWIPRPEIFPFLERWLWMSTNVYMDSETDRGQYYVFTPRDYLQYNQTWFQTGGAVMYNPWYNPSEYGTTLSNTEWNPVPTGHTWAEYKRVMNNMFTSLLNSEDRGIMYGDILKAIGPDKIYAMPDLPVDYTVSPIYDREVLAQIENLTVAPVKPFAIMQKYEKIFTNWVYSSNTPLTSVQLQRMLLPRKRLLNAHDLVPTPAWNMTSTRLMALGHVGGGTEFISPEPTATVQAIVPETCGTEIVTDLHIYSYWWTDNSANESLQQQGDLVILPINQYLPNLISTSALQAFDWAPWIWDVDTTEIAKITDKSANSDVAAFELTSYRAFGDWDVYTTVDVDMLKKANLAALYHEFGVPMI